MSKVSIIVPIYKAEQFINKCIDSILSQTYNDFELILVDDGSPDNSGTICDEYVRKDTRIKVFHKSNGGVSSARNFGIEKACGDWITFVDSDDWIDDDTLLNSVNAISQGVDMVIFGIKVFIGQPPKLVNQNLQYIGHVSDFRKQMEEADRKGWLQGPVNKLFLRSILIKNNLRFDETMSYGEDTKFSFSYINYCKNIKILPYLSYSYCFVNNQSLTNQKLSWKYRKNLAELLRELRTKMYVQFSMNSTYNTFIQFTYATWMTNTLTYLVKSNESDKYSIYKSIIKDLRHDLFMKSYKPGLKSSVQYSIYMRFPLVWYIIRLLI